MAMQLSATTSMDHSLAQLEKRTGTTGKGTVCQGTIRKGTVSKDKGCQKTISKQTGSQIMSASAAVPRPYRVWL